MVNKLITGIGQAIRREFPETTYKIYTEKTEQDLKRPCFFILCVNQRREAKLNERFRLNSSFDIQYFPYVGNVEGGETAGKLWLVLEWVTIDDALIRGSSMNYKIEDGILHFFVDYNVSMDRKKEPNVFMEEVKVNGEISKKTE
ncbi:phage tail terminator family protein [Anaerotignum sp.]|uniref:phage tail terminator family protein n=1 Tax=Anaerotignum sp. TaxID=2039241 RepID=UPI0028AD6104|nr:hypothetical protein [Anaerotignum sp.]